MEEAPEAKDKQAQPNHPDTQSIYPTPTVGIGAPAPSAPPSPAPIAEPVGAAPSPPAPSPVTADQSHNTHEGLHILQWLTFMFWGLTVLALSFLTASVFQRLIAGTDSMNFNYYVIASLIILLPLAFVCDMIYAKQEPVKKVGASSRIMAAYSVIFALFGIAALLSIAWNIVAWATGSGLDHSSSIADIVSGVFILFYYLASFMRTLNPSHIGWITKAYRFTILAAVLVFVILGFAKPTFNKSSASTGSSSFSSYSSSTSTVSSSSSNGSKLQPSVVGGTQCDIPVLSDGSTTGQVAISGGATCDEAEADIQGATGKGGGDYNVNGYACTSVRQGAGTQWSSYWNNNFYSYNCTSGNKQVAFNLQTRTQAQSRSTSPSIY